MAVPLKIIAGEILLTFLPTFKHPMNLRGCILNKAMAIKSVDTPLQEVKVDFS